MNRETLQKSVTIFVTVLLIASFAFASSVYTVGTVQGASHEITECTTIESPGNYVLTQDILDASADHCIIINASDVYFDGQGHTIDGVSTRLFGSPFSSGILAEGTIDDQLHNVTISNVTVREWQNGVNIRYAGNPRLEQSQIVDNTMWGVRLVATNNAAVSNNYIANNSRRGIYHSASTVESQSLIQENVIASHGAGILFDGSVSLNEDNQIIHNTLTDSRVGIGLLGSSNSTVASNDILNSSIDGIRDSGSNNLFEENRIANSTRYGILSFGRGLVLDSNTITASGLWDLYASNDIIAHELDIDSTVSFTGYNVKIRSATEPEVSPSGLVSTGQFVEISEAVSSPFLDLDSWLFLNVSYTDQDITANSLDESSLRLYQFNGTNWAIVPDPNGVNEGENYVYGNLTNYSVVAPFGKVQDTAIEVNISIKPEDEPNAINPSSKGVIPVAILNNSDLDVGEVNVSSLRFGSPVAVDNGAGALIAHSGHFEDIDGDGDIDLLIHFSTQDSGFDRGDTTGKLAGELRDGTQIYGIDSVKIVGKP